MNNLKPIQTYYDGHLFRSRLEARWAVVFKTLGVKYEYEPEGFDLGDGLCYLPDFRVKCYGKRGDYESEPFDLYIEVKGKMSENDAKKIRKFCSPKVSVDRWCTNEILGGFCECIMAKNKDESFCQLTGHDQTHYINCEYLFSSECVESMKYPILIVDCIPDEGCSTDCELGDRDIGFGITPFNYQFIDGDWFGAYPAATSDGRFYLFGADSNYINFKDAEQMEYAYRVARCARFEHHESPETVRTDMMRRRVW